jgi:hypothetical protein
VLSGGTGGWQLLAAVEVGCAVVEVVGAGVEVVAVGGAVAGAVMAACECPPVQRGKLGVGGWGRPI